LNFNLELVIPQYQDVILTLDISKQITRNVGTEIEMGNAVLELGPMDNAIIALQNLSQGERINFFNHTYVLASDVQAKHKFATADLVPAVVSLCTAF
jgi:hypothetical protein